MFSARWLSADEAHDWGLVNYVVADDALRTEALAYCEALARRSRNGLAGMKHLAREGMESTLEAGLRLEASTLPGVMRSADVAEGLAAFRDRREPDFH